LIVKCDWFEVAIKSWRKFGDTEQKLVGNITGLDSSLFVVDKGYGGYRYRLEYDGIHLLYESSSPYAGVKLRMSGEGMETFRTRSAYSFDQLVHSTALHTDVSSSRLDMCVDDFSGKFAVEHLLGELMQGRLSTRIRRSYPFFGVDNSTGDISGMTIYHGEKTSEKRYYAYDKVAEREEHEVTLPDGVTNWLRYEGRFRRRVASDILECAVQTGRDVHLVFLDKLFSDLSWKTPNGDTNRSRWPESDWWRDFKERAYASVNDKSPTAFTVEDSGGQWEPLAVV